MCMSIFRVTVNNYVEIFNCFFMVVNHLIRFGSLVDVSYVCRYFLNTSTERENCLFELFDSAVGQAKMVVNIGLVG